MVKVREVYTNNASVETRRVTSLAPTFSSIGTTFTDIAEIRNNSYPLYDKKENIVGKLTTNTNVNYDANNIGGVRNATYLFNDGSYVMTLNWFNGKTNIISPNAKYVNKAISTGGRYAGKDVTVTIKTDETPIRKIILEYEK